METDFLVIGSGIAGLTFAMDASAHSRVTVITKKDTPETNTNYAQGGIAAALSPTDSVELHIKDTLEVGDGLCNSESVNLIATQAPSVIMELSALGVDFYKTPDNKIDLGREGGHSQNRIVHTKDATGKTIENVLIKTVKERGVSLFEHCLVLDLILEDNKCIGVWVLKEGEVLPFFASSVIIATGGIGNIYLHTTNSPIASGDGISMAYRAGAVIGNMEFIQFHPTAFYGKKIDGRAFLLSEAIRGEGGILKTQNGCKFMDKYDSRGDLAPRDIVARAIHSELKKRQEPYVLLDITHLSESKIKDRFPTIYKTCCGLGINPANNPIPVVPAAHYVCGGIVVDMESRTNIPNLLAIGESAHTGVHGANRLASNSLLESIVFAHRAARKIKNQKSKIKNSSFKIPVSFPDKEGDTDIIRDYLFKIKKIMWEKVGIIRNDKELAEAQTEIGQYKLEIEKLYPLYRQTVELVELRNIVTTASLVIECALRRKESRGLHYNINYSSRNDLEYKKDTIIAGQSYR
ncbi:MAG: L-aspartate oxidase [Candidatus Stahlbacteria bacterium]|nr:L-aspartate oxidase [Candidatus Stahlbacteria bacterium]